jgi:uncharacterized protein YkwD
MCSCPEDGSAGQSSSSQSAGSRRRHTDLFSHFHFCGNPHLEIYLVIFIIDNQAASGSMFNDVSRQHETTDQDEALQAPRRDGQFCPRRLNAGGHCRHQYEGCNKIMLTRSWPIIFVVLGFARPSAALAQVVEEHETEILKPVPGTYEPEHKPDNSEAAKRIILLTNQFREQEKLARVAVNPELQKAAQYFADYMARTLRYGHTADGAEPDERAQKFGYDYCIVAENIAYEYNSAGFTTRELASEFFEAWKASPGHRKNMLDPDVIETGLAIAQGVDSGYFFAVQVFGRPKSKAVEFTITNEAPIAVEYKMGDRTFTLEPRHIRTHQVCRPRDLAFQWPDGKGESRTVQPNHGDHFVVTQEGEKLQLRKDKD